MDHHNFFFTFLFLDIMVGLGLNHMFKGSGVSKSVCDLDEMSELNKSILGSTEFVVGKAQIVFEVFDDLAVFLVCFIGILGLGQFFGGWWSG